MKEHVSIEEAIKKGRRMVSEPAFLIFIMPTFFWFFIAIVGGLAFWVIPAELVLAKMLSLLYRSIMVSRWRLWAFENVADVHKLKKRAIEEKLIGNDGSFFEKIEIRSAAQKEKWALLSNRFKQHELFIDNPGIPEETVINNEKGKNNWSVSISISFIVFGLSQIIAYKSYIYGPFMLLLGSKWFYRWYKIKKDFRPEIVINSNGIMTTKKGLHQWREITNDRVIIAGGRHIENYYLIYDYAGGAERLYINNFNIDEKTLNNLLEVYRGRNNERSHQTQSQAWGNNNKELRKTGITSNKSGKVKTTNLLETLNTNKPKIDIGKFIIETFKKTISASKSRLVIFCIILFLQFWAVNMVTYLSAHNYPNTYIGLTQKRADESLIGTFLGLIKYVLLLILIIRSPAERTRRRRLAKYIVLLGSFYLWAMTDLMSSVFKYDSQESDLAAQSFKENSIPIYGKVVFASYERREGPTKISIVAEKPSAQTEGYLVIVQLDRSLYPYPGLEAGYHHFNDYTHDRYDTTFQTNILRKVPDLSNCREFFVNFPFPRKVIPNLPAVDKYVRIMYDTIKNGIEMYSDSATAATPTFDTIPGVNRQKTGD